MGGFMNRKKLFQYAKGFRGRSNHCYRLVFRRVEKALQHAYVGRKQKKRQYRSVWISRINAGARAYGLTYGHLIHGLQAPTVQCALNRKMMAQLAIYEPFSFQALIHTVQKEAAIKPKFFESVGLLQTSLTSDTHAVTRQPKVQVWHQEPKISDKYYEAQQRRLDNIALQQEEEAQYAQENAQA